MVILPHHPPGRGLTEVSPGHVSVAWDTTGSGSYPVAPRQSTVSVGQHVVLASLKGKNG